MATLIFFPQELTTTEKNHIIRKNQLYSKFDASEMEIINLLFVFSFLHSIYGHYVMDERITVTDFRKHKRKQCIENGQYFLRVANEYVIPIHYYMQISNFNYSNAHNEIVMIMEPRNDNWHVCGRTHNSLRVHCDEDAKWFRADEDDEILPPYVIELCGKLQLQEGVQYIRTRYRYGACKGVEASSVTRESTVSVKCTNGKEYNYKCIQDGYYSLLNSNAPIARVPNLRVQCEGDDYDSHLAYEGSRCIYIGIGIIVILIVFILLSLYIIYDMRDRKQNHIYREAPQEPRDVIDKVAKINNTLLHGVSSYVPADVIKNCEEPLFPSEDPPQTPCILTSFPSWRRPLQKMPSM